MCVAICFAIFLANELMVSQRQLELVVELLVRSEEFIRATVTMLRRHRAAIAIHARLLAITIRETTQSRASHSLIALWIYLLMLHYVATLLLEHYFLLAASTQAQIWWVLIALHVMSGTLLWVYRKLGFFLLVAIANYLVGRCWLLFRWLFWRYWGSCRLFYWWLIDGDGLCFQWFGLGVIKFL